MAARTLSYFSISPSQRCKRSVPENSFTPNPKSLSCSSLRRGLPFGVSSLSIHTSKRRSLAAATLTSDPPSSYAERVNGVEPKWSARAIKSFQMAELEARKLKHLTTGTESLLMGILVEGTSSAAKFLRECGVTLSKVRHEAVELLGKSDMFIYSPEHPPLTKPAQKAIDWAVDAKLKSGQDGELTVAHILLGIWSQTESAGHIILDTLGFDDEKASELANFTDKDITMSFR
ncbi:unnamed protein product [Cuscuta campestris]|uniref:Clp R domain-containing protein n=1 Tax=Cuscuta campestris TaxID=132261 RepID=A0A484LMG4_9ASTE|nr:unnamed protein product [Cuscuta campestris]